MKTNALIDMLARGAGPAPRTAAGPRLASAIAIGMLMSAALSSLIIGSLPAAAFATPAPWIKLAYALSLMAAAGFLTARLARPIARLAAPRKAVVGVLLAIALAGGAAAMTVPQGERLAAVLGATWLVCPWLLMAVSLPALAGTLWAVRGLAPTRLRSAGFAAGLLAGAVGAVGYSLACPEASPAFVAVWYTLGIGLTAFVGAVLGPRVLRW